MKEEKMTVVFNESCKKFIAAPSSSVRFMKSKSAEQNDYGFWDNVELEDDELTKKAAMIIYEASSLSCKNPMAQPRSSAATTAMSSAFTSSHPSRLPSTESSFNSTPAISRTTSPQQSSGKTYQNLPRAASDGPAMDCAHIPTAPTTSPVDDRVVATSTGSKVVYLLEKRSTVATRSFGQLAMQVCVSMGGIRIVQDNLGEHVEFKVNVTVGDQIDISNWKKFSDFEELAEALKAFANGSSDDGGFDFESCFHCFFFSTKSQRLSERDQWRRCMSLRSALSAWEDVLASRSWSWLNRLSVQQLVQEARELEKFLQEVLFEIPTPDVLIEFASSITVHCR
jgi:hypothetical protein